MKILICDDNKTILDELKRKVVKIISNAFNEKSIIVDTFSDAHGLYDYIYDSKIIPDVVIMDICLGEDDRNNGIEVARRIKKEYRNINIIFCTGNAESIADAFEVEPLYVLFKPFDDKKLMDALEKVYRHIEDSRRRCVTIKAIKGIYRVMVKDIDYLESQGRYVKIHINGEEIVTINKLQNLMELLGNDFLQCHKSFVVNYNKIKMYDDTRIILFSEEKVAVSRHYKKEIKDNLLNRI